MKRPQLRFYTVHRKMWKLPFSKGLGLGEWHLTNRKWLKTWSRRKLWKVRLPVLQEGSPVPTAEGSPHTGKAKGPQWNAAVLKVMRHWIPNFFMITISLIVKMSACTIPKLLLIFIWKAEDRTEDKCLLRSFIQYPSEPGRGQTESQAQDSSRISQVSCLLPRALCLSRELELKSFQIE